ncbi:MAG: hypothetical protein RLZZ86_3428 [Cyanobacteriota bacterium]
MEKQTLPHLLLLKPPGWLGIPIRGTLGIVLTAKQRGIIRSARPVLEQLRLRGMYLSDKVINQALTLVGE